METHEWVFPDTVNQAIHELAKPGSQAVAGGTTVLDLLKLNHRTGPRLVDLSKLGLNTVCETSAKTVIGGLSSNTEVADSMSVKKRHPAVSEAILLGASQQIRNSATVGGNLMQATRCGYFRATEWPCNRRLAKSGCAALENPGGGHAILGTSTHCIATHPSDMAVALLMCSATVVCETSSGTHRIPMSEFFRLPDSKPHLETHLPESALITEVELPHDQMFENSGYIKLRGRASYEFASAAVAAALELKGGIVQRVAIALGGVATVPWRDTQAEQILIGQYLTTKQIDLYCDMLLETAVSRPETQHKIPLVRGAIHSMLTRLAEQKL